MPFPAAPTESGGDKLHFLTTDANVAGGWFGVDTGVTGTGANTVAFAAIATHVHDDAAGSPGGLAASSVPLVLVGGVRDDVLGGLTPVEGDTVYLLVDANGALWTHDSVLDAALAGNEIQVDIVAALPAGANTIGEVTIGAATAAAGDLAKAEDAVHGSGDIGVMALTVRNDVLAALAGADGDYAPLQVNALGALYIQEGAALDVSAATVPINLIQVGGVAVVTGGVAGSQGVGGLAAEGAAVAGNPVLIAGSDGVNVETILVSAAGRQVFMSSSAAGDGSSNSIALPLVSATLSFKQAISNFVFNGVTWDRMRGTVADGLLVNLGANNDVDTELPAALVLADAMANPTAPAVAAHLMAHNGVTWDRVFVSGTSGGIVVEEQGTASMGDATDPVSSKVASFLYGFNGATFDRLRSSIAQGLEVDVTRVQGTVTVDLGVNNDVTVDGSVAHDALDSGGLGPVKVGGRAQEPEAQPDEVADNDRVDALFDRSGYLRVRGDFDPSFADINDALSGDNTIIAAQAAGKRIAVWSIMIVADGTVDVRWEDGAAGTPFTGQVPLQEREGYTWSAGGLVPLFVGSAATLLNLELSAAIAVHGLVSYTVIDD